MSSMIQSVSITNHTTASSPHPHILYIIDVTARDGSASQVSKRYSEFVTLHDYLNDQFSLPPKRILTTTFIPSAWVDDALIAERKTGLSNWLNDVIKTPEFSDNTALGLFLTPTREARDFDVEDALPSTMSRKQALELIDQQQSADAVTPIACAYYPDWASSPSVSGIDYSKFDIIFFAFATPNSSSTLSWDSGAQTTLTNLVNAAHGSSHKTKVVLSVGGWGGSYWFSQTMSTSSNRTTFVNAIASAISQFNLDGVDIDWEYPNQSGAGNPHSSSDAANLLLFFQAMRSNLGSSKIISAAVTDLPWTGSNGSSLTDVSAYAAQMTYANIMNYDVNGASSTPGPNAPLGNLCGTSSQPQASAEAAFAQWTNAGFPANKLLLGLPLYGYVSNSTKTVLTGSFKEPDPSDAEESKSEQKTLNEKHERKRTKVVKDGTAATGDLSGWYGQQIPFNSLLASGAIVKQSDGTYTGANGYTFNWDNCSDTPYIFNVSRSTVVTYDDTYSLNDKAAYAKSAGMAGTFTWSLDQDDGTALQQVIRSALGI